VAKEAAKRKLSNIKNTPQALELWQTPKAKEALVKSGMFTERELDARYEIFHENYVKHIQIEGRLLGELAMDYVVPAAIDYQNKLLENVNGLKNIGIAEKNYSTQKNLLTEISAHIAVIVSQVDKMTEARKVANNLHHAPEKSKAYCEKVLPHFDTIRDHCDKLEQILDDQSWRLPKYREMLFIK